MPLVEPSLLAAALRSLDEQQVPGVDVVVVQWGPTADAATGNSARNAGARVATGDHLFFLDHRTRLRPGALQRLTGAGNQNRGYRVVRATGDRGPFDPASYLFSATHWADSALGFDETHGDFPDATCARAMAAHPVRVEGQLWDRVGTEPEVTPSWSGSLEAWLAMVPAVRQMVHGPEKAQWIRELLVGDVQGLLTDAERLPHERLPYLADTIGTLLAALPSRDLSRVPVEARAAAWLGGQAHWSELAELLAGRPRREGDFPTRVEGTRVYAELPGAWDALRAPEPMLEVGLDETRMTCSVRRVRWVEGAAGLSLAVDLFVGVRHVTLAAPLVQARWVSRTASVVARVEPRADPLAGLSGQRHHDQSNGSVTVSTPLAGLARGGWRLELAITQDQIVRIGRARNRDTSGSAGELRPAPDGSAQPVWGPDGLRLLVAAGGTYGGPGHATGLRVTGVRHEGDSLLVDTTGPVRGTPVLASRGGALLGTVEGSALRFRLRADPFGTGERPAPSGRYRLLVGDRPVSPAVVDDLPFELRADDHRIGVQRSSSGAVVVALRPPLRDDELGGFAQQQLFEAYDAPQPLVDQVLLESMAGRSCTGSPLAIDLELARSRPDLTRLWAVEDHAAVVPPGAWAVLRHSREWYAALATSRWVFLDGELPAHFCRREGQQVVQTLAGHPVRVLDVSAGQWSTLLVPNARLEARLRTCFRYDGEVLPAGLPRTDLLIRPDGEARRDHTRAALGIGPGQTVVLHAPEPRPAAGLLAEPLDVAELCRRLGPGHTVLLRDAGRPPVPDEVPGCQVVDVTDHPEVADVMLAADCLVTDHSSLSFDFALLCRPMVFHLPDGRGDAPGFLFPPAETTPGPVCAGVDEVAEQLLDLDGVSRRYASALAEYNARFNDMCDGHAAERVVAATLGSRTGAGRFPPTPGDRMAESR
ncbi:MAG: CDP-glycerol glycerophosphotransferase family protein [Marmoricola sp.]